jgi:hypothetical protein
MSRHTATWLTRALGGLSVAMLLASVALYFLARFPPSPHLTMWRALGPTTAVKRTVATDSAD